MSHLPEIVKDKLYSTQELKSLLGYTSNFGIRNFIINEIMPNYPDLVVVRGTQKKKRRFVMGEAILKYRESQSA